MKLKMYSVFQKNKSKNIYLMRKNSEKFDFFRNDVIMKLHPII